MNRKIFSFVMPALFSFCGIAMERQIQYGDEISQLTAEQEKRWDDAVSERLNEGITESGYPAAFPDDLSDIETAERVKMLLFRNANDDILNVGADGNILW